MASPCTRGGFSSSVVDSLLDGLEDLAIVRQVQRLEHQREWSVIATDSLNGCLKVIERVLLDSGSEFSTESASDGGLVRNDALSSLLNRVDYSLTVPRKDGAQIDYFAGDAELLCPAYGHADLAQLHSIAYDGDIGAFLHDLSLAERYLIVLDGNILLGDSVEDFGFEEQARVVCSDAREQEALGLDRRPRDGNL